MTINPTHLFCGVLLFLALFLSLHYLTPPQPHTHNPRQQAIIQLACDYPTDGVLNWAANTHHLTINLKEDCK